MEKQTSSPPAVRERESVVTLDQPQSLPAAASFRFYQRTEQHDGLATSTCPLILARLTDCVVLSKLMRRPRRRGRLLCGVSAVLWTLSHSTSVWLCHKLYFLTLWHCAAATTKASARLKDWRAVCFVCYRMPLVIRLRVYLVSPDNQRSSCCR